MYLISISKIIEVLYLKTEAKNLLLTFKANSIDFYKIC